ncbi:MAG: thiW protein [Clostridia bacterium]|nr:thiW protein [Clostridia bacterium]
MNNQVKKLSLAGVLIALAVVCSAFYIPVGIAKCFPIQHMVNVLSGVLLGPWYALGVAFCTSLIRVILGTGSILAFPGSMFGAVLSGLFYIKTRKLMAAFAGEVFGTGIIGALASYPIATLVMAREAALFGFVVPFGMSSLMGAAFSLVLINVMARTKVIDKVAQDLK